MTHTAGLAAGAATGGDVFAAGATVLAGTLAGALTREVAGVVIVAVVVVVALGATTCVEGGATVVVVAAGPTGVDA